jgi:hypothetical protein
MQGNCAAEMPTSEELGLPPGAPPLRPRVGRQCLLLADGAVLATGEGAEVWVDGLYVRLGTPRQEEFQEFVAAKGKDTMLWLTQVTLQGNGGARKVCAECGLDVGLNAAAYAEGSVGFALVS